MNNTMITVSLADATEAQLRWFMENVLSVTPHHMAKEQSLIAKIRQAGHDKADISVPEGLDAAPTGKTTYRTDNGDPSNPRAIGARSGAKDPKVRLRISNQDIPGGDEPIPVNVNGTLMYIPREEEVEIAYRYYEVLKNAVQTLYSAKTAPNGIDMEITSRDANAFPLSILHMPPQDEIDAWVKAQQAAA